MSTCHNCSVDITGRYAFLCDHPSTFVCLQCSQHSPFESSPIQFIPGRYRIYLQTGNTVKALLVNDEMVVGSLLDLTHQEGLVYNGQKMISTDTLAKYYIQPDDLLLIIDDAPLYIPITLSHPSDTSTFTTVKCHWDDPCYRLLSEVLQRYPAPTSNIQFELNGLPLDPMKSLGVYYGQLQSEFTLVVYYPHGIWFRVYINNETEPRWYMPCQTIYDICIDVQKFTCIYNGVQLTPYNSTLGELGIVDTSHLLCY